MSTATPRAGDTSSTAMVTTWLPITAAGPSVYCWVPSTEQARIGLFETGSGRIRVGHPPAGAGPTESTGRIWKSWSATGPTEDDGELRVALGTAGDGAAPQPAATITAASAPQTLSTRTAPIGCH